VFLASRIEEEKFSSIFVAASDTAVVFHQNKENTNPKDAILA
jgi:hypothetical protein